MLHIANGGRSGPVSPKALELFHRTRSARRQAERRALIAARPVALVGCARDQHRRLPELISGDVDDVAATHHPRMPLPPVRRSKAVSISIRGVPARAAADEKGREPIFFQREREKGGRSCARPLGGDVRKGRPPFSVPCLPTRLQEHSHRDDELPATSLQGQRVTSRSMMAPPARVSGPKGMVRVIPPKSVPVSRSSTATPWETA